MRKTYSFIIVLLFIFGLVACVSIPNKYESLAPGNWRGVLKIYEKEYLKEELTDSKFNLDFKELPFNFKIEYNEQNQLQFYLINANEVLDIAEITVGLDRQTAKDTVIIDFPIFNTYIKAIHEEGILEGYWYVKYKEGYKIPFIAQHGQDYRFATNNPESVQNITGKWKTTFEYDNEDEKYFAVGEFEQHGNELVGTFRTETGDYRYLQGNVIKNKFFLSTFDGAHAFYFEGKIMDHNNLVGIFKSGNHYTANWIAERNENFDITKGSDLSKATALEESVNFTFLNTEKDSISLSDVRYKDKVKLINIMGTWCPNCMDEVRFLKEFKKEKRAEDIEIISIAFERFKDEEKSFSSLKNYKSKMNLNWEILYGGYANKKENQKVLPFIDKLISYPTLIVLDKNNKIRYIHTGFSGPATSRYESFKKEFNQVVNNLLKQEL